MKYLAFTLMLLAIGCGVAEPKAKDAASAAKHDHSEWWCAEHGVPEEECSRCSRKYASECKRKGDWCAEHGRAKSQCFICDQKLQEKYAGLYRAKYGKEPPAMKDD